LRLDMAVLNLSLDQDPATVSTLMANLPVWVVLIS